MSGLKDPKKQQPAAGGGSGNGDDDATGTHAGQDGHGDPGDYSLPDDIGGKIGEGGDVVPENEIL